MAGLTPRLVFRMFEVDGVPSSGKHNPEKSEIIQLLDQMQGSSAAPTVIKATRAELNAVTPASEDYGGIVLNDPDPTKNGYYYRVAAAWVRTRGLPDTFARLEVSGGTANAVQAAASVGVNPSDIELFAIEPTATNTGNVTLSVAGATAKPVLNVNGNQLAPGEWTAGRRILFEEDATVYRLLSDPDADGAALAAAASATAAAADRGLAQVARAGAEAAAAGVTVGLAKARVLASINVNLASPGASIDGLAMSAGQTFLATAQTAPAQNGLYVWNGAAVAATRQAVYSTYDAIAGQYFSILEGAENGDTLWRSTSDLGGTLGTTAIVFEKYTAALVVRRQVFTVTGTYTPHAKMAYCEIECVGGGGAGGGSANGSAGSAGGAGGGGAGSMAKKIATRADIGASKAVTIGAGGVPGAAGANPGGNGGQTSVGALCVAPGGAGAVAGFGTAGGAGGAAGTGDVTLPGSKGGSGPLQTILTVNATIGAGAPSVYGGSAGLVQAGATQSGAAASGYGAGGNGGLTWNAGGAVAGGAGSPGLVVITEMCTG